MKARLGRTAFAAAIFAAAASGAVAAQDTAGAAAAATAPGGCELHIWPAERFNAVTTGWLSGLGAIGAVADASKHAGKDKNNRSQMASALDSVAQVDALTSLDLFDQLKIPPAAIIKHETPLERHTMNKIKTRRAESKSPCYSELIVADLFYQKAAIYGRSFRALFMLREFGAGATPVRVYKSWGGNGLKLFPPKAGEDEKAALDELVSVFKRDFEEFARNEVRARTGTAEPAKAKGS